MSVEDSWQNITASYVNGQHGRNDTASQGGRTFRDAPRPRRALPIPPEEDVTTPLKPLPAPPQQALNQSSDSWSSIHSVHSSAAHVEDSSDSIDPELPGAFTGQGTSSSMLKSHHIARSAQPEDSDDPFSPSGLAQRPSSPQSTGDSESTTDSIDHDSIASSIQTPRKTQTPSRPRQFPIRSPRTPRGLPLSARRAMLGDNGELRRRKREGSHAQEETPRRTRRRPQQTNLAFQAVRHISSIIYTLISIPLGAVTNIVTGPLQTALFVFFLSILVIGTLWYILRAPIQAITSALSSFSAIGMLSSPLSGLKNIHIPMKDAYCSTIGIGCRKERIQLGYVANQIGTQALKAHDMFTSVVALGDPAALALNHAEIWELAVAVKVSSGMENKDELGKSLAEFGTLVRDVKDAMYVLHGKGINTFQWALHRFSRLEKTIELANEKPESYPPKRLKQQLDDLFDHLGTSLSDLITSIEHTIPIANQASLEAGSIRQEFGSEFTMMQRARDDQPFWRRLKDITSTSGRQLRKDIQMTRETIDAVKDLRFNLENTRTFLINYRDHVSYFQSGMQGYHIGDHGLDPEDEVATLREIMQRFENSVSEAKHASSPEGLREAKANRLKGSTD